MTSHKLGRAPVVLLAAVLTGCSVGSTPHVPVTAPSLALSHVVSVLSVPSSPGAPASPEPVAATRLRAIQAVGETDLLGLWSSSTGRGWLATSADGGSTWREAGTSLPIAVHKYPSVSIAFASARRGAMFVSGRLLTTVDGGATWRRVEVRGQILDLSIAGGMAWVLSESCQKARLGRCELSVLTDDLLDAGAWTSRPLPFTVTKYADPIIAVSSAHDAMLDLSGYDPGQLVQVTSDGGRHWRVAGAPCGAKTLVHVGRRTVEERWESLEGLASGVVGRTREWWAVCGGGAAAGTATKGLEVSADDGGLWSQIAAFPSIAPYRNPANLPAGDFGGLTALRGGRLVMITPDELGFSDDRGSQWRGVEGVNLGGTWASATADAHGMVWVLAPGVGLWRSDGGLETFERL